MDLTPFRWAEHVAVRRVTNTRHDRPPSPQTLAIELMRAKQLLEFGVTNGFLPSNPLAAAPREKVISMRETWLDESGILALLDGIKAVPEGLPRLLTRAFILLLVDSMLRFEEARGLRRDRIRDAVTELSAKRTKSKKVRTVGLTPRTLVAIADVPPVVGDPRIFLNPETGKLFGQTTMRRWFRAACIESKVDLLAVEGERVVPHTMRHSGASAADERGGSPLAIRDCLGHSTLATTERYLHRHRAQGAKNLAQLMAEGAERERRGPQRAPQPEHEPINDRTRNKK